MTTNPFELPPPVVIDNLLPLLSNRDLASLRSVSKQVKALAEDEVLWKRNVLADYTFPAHATARMGGWYNLYKGISNPDVYVWGQDDNGRLGGIDIQHLSRVYSDNLQYLGGVPYPIKLDSIGSAQSRMLQTRQVGVRDKQEQPLGEVVEIVAGGWSFHARTSTGRVWFWGTMDGERAWRSAESLRHPGNQVRTPQLMHDLPPIQSLAGGRCHVVGLSREHRILEWTAWGTIWEHEGFPPSINGAPSPTASASSADESMAPGSNIKQLEAGWSFSAILTHSGQVWLWYSAWSESAFVQAFYRGQEREADLYRDPPGNGHLKRFPINVAPVSLPPIIPDQQQPQQGQDQDHHRNKIIQIAAGEDFVIALTEAGTLHRIDLHLPPPTLGEQVLANQAHNDMFGDGDGPFHVQHRIRMTRFLQNEAQWERLSAFEDPQSLSTFDPAWLDNGHGAKGTVGKIAHISAHFRQFVVFHTVLPPDEQHDVRPRDQQPEQEPQTLVLLGSSRASEPELIPDLQARGVIKVTMGDYHYGALTQKGEILTWGSFSKGALGNWDAPWASSSQATDLATPTPDPIPAGGEPDEQNGGDEGERGGFSNLVPLPQILRGGGAQRGLFQPRVGFAGRGRVGRGGVVVPRGSAVARYVSDQDVATPMPIKITPQPRATSANGGGAQATPFAFDIAFAGWHSSALAMDAPVITATTTTTTDGTADGTAVAEAPPGEQQH